VYIINELACLNRGNYHPCNHLQPPPSPACIQSPSFPKTGSILEVDYLCSFEPCLSFPSPSPFCYGSYKSHVRQPFYFFITLTHSQLASYNYSDFLALRKTCRDTRRVSEAHMFQRLAIKGNGDDILSARLLARLRDTSDALATHVEVIELHPSDVEVLAVNLRDVWSRLRNLKVIT
jgi:hypothetical protein